MRHTRIAIALAACLSVSTACSRNAETSGKAPEAAKPAPPEMQIKQDLLARYAPPDAVPLKTVRQLPNSQGLLNYPIALSLSDDGGVYVSDNNGQAIYHTTPELKVFDKLPTQEAASLNYPNAIQVRRNKIFIADNDGIKVFGRDGSFLELLRIYYSIFHFTIDAEGNIFANPSFLEPKESDPLIVGLDAKGMRVGSFGKRMNRSEHDGLEDRAYLCVVGDMVIAAFKHRPHIQVYQRQTGELIRAFDVTHPIFPDLLKLAEDKKFVNPRPGVVRLPLYIGGVEATPERIYVLLSLPQPEIIELSLQGDEIARYRDESSATAFGYFGFDVRSTGNTHQFTLGMLDQQRRPVLVTLSSSAHASQTKEKSK